MNARIGRIKFTTEMLYHNHAGLHRNVDDVDVNVENVNIVVFVNTNFEVKHCSTV